MRRNRIDIMDTIDKELCCCSFAMVIQQLPEGLRDAFCVLYLVLRALDTVEDDMSIPIDKKVPLLHAFHTLSQQR